jgi:F0F1-type ATP synthase assembly protein I
VGRDCAIFHNASGQAVSSGTIAAVNKRYAPLQLLGIGWYIVVAVGLGVAGGVWLDGLAGASPLFTVIGILLGVTVALVGAFRMMISATAPERGSRSHDA